jgi:hypothetical protein
MRSITHNIEKIEIEVIEVNRLFSHTCLGEGKSAQEIPLLQPDCGNSKQAARTLTAP